LIGLEVIDLSDEFVSEEHLSDLILKLLEMGALEVKGYDDLSDQFIYNLTPKCQELFPELFDEHFRMINEIAFTLWTKELIEMTFDSDGTPMIMPKDIEYTKSVLSILPEEERFFLQNLLDKYEKDTKER
jgi:hypothetical protein